MVIITGVEVDETRLAAICEKYGIAELKVFGSRAHGQAAPDSDIDILYTLRPGRRLVRRQAVRTRSMAGCTWWRAASRGRPDMSSVS